MDGKEIMNFTVGVVPVDVVFPTIEQHADIVIFGPGTVWLSWRKQAAIDDPECIKLTPDKVPGYELRQKAPWKVLSFVATEDTVIQVVTR